MTSFSEKLQVIVWLSNALFGRQECFDQHIRRLKQTLYRFTIKLFRYKNIAFPQRYTTMLCICCCNFGRTILAKITWINLKLNYSEKKFKFKHVSTLFFHISRKTIRLLPYYLNLIMLIIMFLFVSFKFYYFSSTF